MSKKTLFLFLLLVIMSLLVVGLLVLRAKNTDTVFGYSDDMGVEGLSKQ